jgi:hypothetical protein
VPVPVPIYVLTRIGAALYIDCHSRDDVTGPRQCRGPFLLGLRAMNSTPAAAAENPLPTLSAQRFHTRPREDNLSVKSGCGRLAIPRLRR